MSTKALKPLEPIENKQIVPVLPLRDVVVYPHMVIPLFVGRKKSIQALEAAMKNNKHILLAAQKDSEKDNPRKSDIYSVGTLASILQLLKLPDGTVKVLVEGLQRAKILGFESEPKYFSVKIQLFPETVRTFEGDDEENPEVIARSLMHQFEQYVKLNKKIPAEILASLAGIQDPARLGDTIAAHMSLKIEEKQTLLAIESLSERLEMLLGYLVRETKNLQIDKRVRNRVKDQMEKKQREYYINEQMEALQKELGENQPNEAQELADKIQKAGMPKEAEEKTTAELNKLKLMSPMSAEATVLRNYIDWMVKVPWKKHSKIHYDLIEAQDSLDADHYGLEKVKERIIEYLAVQQRVKKLKGPVLCLVGPPGVGKTSLGQSIAKATGRKFVRMSLGGVRDEAEIRGHRRTYIGSMPGKILQQLAKVGVRNPLFLLDEVDKMSMDFRGDPASAMLEVLDPEQNHTFNDHYLEVDYDLSDVMFVATANSLEIPAPLLDRMEIIRLAGYTEDEKVNIALQHLVAKQLKANGVSEDELEIKESALRDIVRYYTREAGVRNLEREISKICRKTVKALLSDPEKSGAKKTRKKATKKTLEKVTITAKDLEKYLGVKKYRYGIADEYNQVGQVKGLAWTEFGGELLTIEAASVEGKGKTIYTGQLGEVMQESIQAAMTVVRSRAEMLDVPKSYFEKHDIHIHVPEGATPKDGPSAGIGMCLALASVITGIPVRADVAMTGEITLRGEVLPIGGLKEKLLAALRGKIRTVIIPHENERDLKEIPERLLKGLDIRPVKWIDEVLLIALESLPTGLEQDAQSHLLIKKAPGGRGKRTKSTQASSNH